jgi:hypothetical protein
MEITMKRLVLILCLPALAFAQLPQFQLEPGAFPVEINGWEPYQPWAGGNHPSTPEFCDIDGDGDLDYFSGSQANYFWYYANTGNAAIPNFQYNSSTFDSIYPVCPGSAYESDIDFCDIDGDGDFDAIICNGNLGVAINQGTLAQWDFAPADTLFDQNHQFLSATNVAAADIDGDGDYDLFGGTFYSGQLRFFQNVGTPQNYQYNLITQAWQNVQVAGGKADPCFADLDQDGDLDLLVGSGNGMVSYYRNDGTPTNPQMTLVTTSYLGINVQANASPELADIDGDGDLDLFVGRSSSEDQNPTQGDIFFYRNVGTPQNPNFAFVTSNYLTWDCGYGSTPRLVDMNGDGLPDLISRMASHLIYYTNEGTLGDPRFVYQISNFGGIQLADLIPWFVDLDGDGDYDLLAGTSAIPGPPGLHYYRNQGSPQNPNFVLVSSNLVPGVFTQNSVLLSPWTADIDADGDQDLFVTDDTGHLYFFRNTGSLNHFHFVLESTQWQGIGIGNPPPHHYACFYDIDEDGDLDLFIDKSSYYYQPWEKTLMFYRNIGTPQNANMQLVTDNLFPDLMIWQAAPYLLDIDLDGDGDMFLGDSWGGIRFFRNLASLPNPNAACPAPVEMQIALVVNSGSGGPATISYVLPTGQHVNLSVYNILGSRLATLVDGLQQPGGHVSSWEAKGKAAGVYLLRLQAGGEVAVKKVVVVR